MSTVATYKFIPLTSKRRSGSVPPMNRRASVIMGPHGLLSGQTAVQRTHIGRFSIAQPRISNQPMHDIFKWSKFGVTRISMALPTISMKKPSCGISSNPTEVAKSSSIVKHTRHSFDKFPENTNCGHKYSIPSDGWNYKFIVPSESTKRYVAPTQCDSRDWRSMKNLAGISSLTIFNRRHSSVGANRFLERHNYEVECETPADNDSLPKLRARTLLARDQLSKHKILLDRYLPLHIGPEPDVAQAVENRYEELLSRMPLTRLKQSYNEEKDYFTDITPYKPAKTTNTKDKRPYEMQHVIVKNSFTPKISDTRKRARSVLCKVKGDPHYFDF